MGPSPCLLPSPPTRAKGPETRLSPAPPPPAADYSLAVPQHLEELYEAYLRELEEGGLERATIMDRVASRALQVGAGHVLGEGPMPKALPWDQAGLHPRKLPPFLLTPPKALPLGMPNSHILPPLGPRTLLWGRGGLPVRIPARVFPSALPLCYYLVRGNVF